MSRPATLADAIERLNDAASDLAAPFRRIALRIIERIAGVIGR